MLGRLVKCGRRRSAVGVAPSHVLGSLDASTYLDFIDREYLAPYVGHGGAAVKLLAVGDESAAKELAGWLASTGDGFQHAVGDAATTRVHMGDHVLAAVARQLDWVACAGSVGRVGFDAW